MWEVQDKRKRRYRNKGETSVKTETIRERAPEFIRGVERRDENKNVSARPTGLRENIETAISGGGSGLVRKEKEM